MGQVDQTLADLAETDGVIGDPLETSGGRPQAEPLGPSADRIEPYRGDPLHVPGLPVDLVIPALPVTVLREREVGPAVDGLAVKLEHEPPHPGESLVERDRAFEGQVAQVELPPRPR